MDDAKEDLQYEQKRMNATRGGETIPIMNQIITNIEQFLTIWHNAKSDRLLNM